MTTENENGPINSDHIRPIKWVWALQLLSVALVVCIQAFLMLGFEVYELDVLALLPYYLQKDYFNTSFVFMFFFLFIQTINGILSPRIPLKFKALPSIRLSDLFWLFFLSTLWWQAGEVLIQGDWIKRQSWAGAFPWILTFAFTIGFLVLIAIKDRFQKIAPIVILGFCFMLSWVNTHVWVDLYLHFSYVVSCTAIVCMQYILTIPQIQKLPLLNVLPKNNLPNWKWFYIKPLQIALIALMVYLTHLFLINEKPYRYIERAKIINRVIYPFQALKPKISLLELLVNNKRFDLMEDQETKQKENNQTTINPQDQSKNTKMANEKVYQNVIWIVVDTLRSDAILNEYWQADLEKQKVNSFNPILQTWMDHSVVFDTAYTSASRTMWAMPSMFNSIYPYEYKTKNHQGVATFFKDNQFVTHAVVPQYFSLPMDENVQDLLIGFDQVSLYDEEKQHNMISLVNDQIHQINQNQGKLPANATQKHFFWLHFYMMHHPGYLNAKSLSASKDGNGKERYRKSLMELDQQLFEVLKSLSALPNYENTLVVFTADHGELLGENGKFGHGAGISSMETNVPMFFDLNPKNALQALMQKFPNQKYNQGKTKFEPILAEPKFQVDSQTQKGFHIKKPAGTVDILPTIAEFAQMTENPMYPFRGRSLRKELLDPSYQADPKNNPYLMQNGNASVVALVDESLKIVFNQNQQKFYMFNVNQDPGLLKDIFNLKEPRSQKMITKFLEKQPLILQNELNQTDKIAIKSQQLLTKKINQLFMKLKDQSSSNNDDQKVKVSTQEFEFWISLLKLYKKHAVLLDPVQKQLLSFSPDWMAFFLREIPIKALDERKGIPNVIKYESILSEYYTQLTKSKQEITFFKALIQKQAKLYFTTEIKAQLLSDADQKQVSPLSETILDYLALNDVPAHLLFRELKALYLATLNRVNVENPAVENPAVENPEEATRQVQMQSIRAKILKLFAQMYYISTPAQDFRKLQDQVSLFLLEESKLEGHLLPSMQQDLYLALKLCKSPQSTPFFIEALKGNDLNLLKISLQALVEVEKENAIEHILPLERNFLMIYDLAVVIRKLIEDPNRLTYALQLKADVYKDENEVFKIALEARKKNMEQAMNWLKKIHKTHYNPINRWEAKKGMDAYDAVGKPPVKKKK